jgi:uncharacterized protein YjbI with pentapeptide repeats
VEYSTGNSYIRKKANLCNAVFNYSGIRNRYIPDTRGAILNRTDFTNAKLVNADLHGSSLVNADLTNANLMNADLSSANFESANLSGTNLNGADLQQADFTYAILTHTDFSWAKVGGTKFLGVDLSTVRGLETAEYWGRSHVDVDTFYQSNGVIPEVFLRGVGLPDDFIIYIKSLTAQPIQFYSCFISYSSKDQKFADRLYADLQNKGVRCWFAPKDIKIGDRIRDRIDESIRLKDKLLLILSKNSILSDWVEHEVESALEEERRLNKSKGGRRSILFPIRLDDSVISSERSWAALIRRTRHIGDFRKWKDYEIYQKAFEKLLYDLKVQEYERRA